MFDHLLKQREFSVLLYAYVIRENFLKHLKHILGWTGKFPNPWGNRSLECWFSNQPVGFTTLLGKWQNMDVSENRGTPKSSILIGFSIINHPFWGIPIFGNTHVKSFVKFFFARKAPDVAILQITGTVKIWAGFLELGDEWWGWFESVFGMYVTKYIYIYNICFIDIYIYIYLFIYIYMQIVYVEREEEKIYRVQFVVCSMQIKNRKPVKRLFEVGDWSC